MSDRLREWAFVCYEAGAFAVVIAVGAMSWGIAGAVMSWLLGLGVIVLGAGTLLRGAQACLNVWGQR